MPTRDIFIVHGRDHEPMKELKTMLIGFGLNPIVLHEQPSGSRTIVEKLEKYSDVGFAFVVLTPDDVGGSNQDTMKALELIVGSTIGIADDILALERLQQGLLMNINHPRRYSGDLADGISRISSEKKTLSSEDIEKTREKLSSIVSSFRYRARQNVVLEFGYFIGLLKRDRVCCLYKGDIELPSDMHGIVYIPFEKSISEVRNQIIKELREVGYKIDEYKAIRRRIDRFEKEESTKRFRKMVKSSREMKKKTGTSSD